MVLIFDGGGDDGHGSDGYGVIEMDVVLIVNTIELPVMSFCSSILTHQTPKTKIILWSTILRHPTSTYYSQI